MIRRSVVVIFALALVHSWLAVSAFAVPTIWTGSDFIFSKAANADPTLPANQDLLTPNVKLTRGSTQGMFNIAVESSLTPSSSPAGTQWATDLTSPSQTITATNFANLTFTNWNAAYLNSPSTNILNRQAVVHLVADDIYLNLKFTAFQGGGTGGQFTYVRSTPVPEPGTLCLAVVAGIGLIAYQLIGRRFNVART